MNIKVSEALQLIDSIEEEEEEEDGYCTACAGTGEGQYDGASCRVCRGSGFVQIKTNDDY